MFPAARLCAFLNRWLGYDSTKPFLSLPGTQSHVRRGGFSLCPGLSVFIVKAGNRRLVLVDADCPRYTEALLLASRTIVDGLPQGTLLAEHEALCRRTRSNAWRATDPRTAAANEVLEMKCADRRRGGGVGGGALAADEAQFTLNVDSIPGLVHSCRRAGD